MLKKASSIGYAAALATSPAWLTACTTQPAAQAEDPTLLFSVSADSMHFEDASGQDVTLVLHDVDPHTVWFTDRPARQSGAMRTDLFTTQWADGETFDVDPPNAALVLHEPVTVEDGSITETMVAEIQHAEYNPMARTFTARLHVMSDEEADAVDGNLGAHGDNHDAAWPNAAGAVSLFVDSVAAGGGVTAPPTSVSSLAVSQTVAAAGTGFAQWRWPAQLGGDASAVSYDVAYSVDGTSWTPVPSSSVTVLQNKTASATINGLPTSSNYVLSVRVIATNSAGAANPVTGTTPIRPSLWPSSSSASGGSNPTPSTQGKIVLCSNPTTCTNSTSMNYTYNSTLYFTTNIQENVTMPAITREASQMGIRL